MTLPVKKTRSKKAPVAEAPEAPVAEAPVAEAPVAQAPVAQAQTPVPKKRVRVKTKTVANDVVDPVVTEEAPKVEAPVACKKRVRKPKTVVKEEPSVELCRKHNGIEQCSGLESFNKKYEHLMALIQKLGSKNVEHERILALSVDLDKDLKSIRGL
jgi:hypothetical protein